MADSMDLVQRHTEELLARNIAAVTRRPAQVSAFFCEACEEAIPEARRRAIQGVNHCVTCQEVNELKGAHYKGGAV